MGRSFLGLLVCFGLFGCGSSKPDTLVTTEYDQKEMDAAIARARSEVDSFIEKLKSRTGLGYAVKVGITDGGETEHFWLTDVKYDNGEFAGIINNEPGLVRNVKFGQTWTVKKDEITDWMYLNGNKMYGNYTMRPLLNSMPKEEADKFRAMLGDYVP